MPSLNPINGALGTRRAAHLLRRTTFRYQRSRVDALAAMTAAEALTNLLVALPLQLEQPVYGSGAVTWVNPPQPPTATLPDADFNLRRYVMGWHDVRHVRSGFIVIRPLINAHRARFGLSGHNTRLLVFRRLKLISCENHVSTDTMCLK